MDSLWESGLLRKIPLLDKDCLARKRKIYKNIAVLKKKTYKLFICISIEKYYILAYLLSFNRWKMLQFNYDRDHLVKKMGHYRWDFVH